MMTFYVSRMEAAGGGSYGSRWCERQRATTGYLFDVRITTPVGVAEGFGMPSTHSSLHIHIVFSTKDRLPFIHPEWKCDLHAFLGGCLKRLDAFPQEIGGVADHVHLLIGVKPVHAIADLVREAKRVSSEWVRETQRVQKFAWQEGYGAFSVSQSAVPSVRKYIQEQEKHHRRRTFQEEYLEFLEKNGVEYDERYLW